MDTPRHTIKTTTTTTHFIHKFARAQHVPRAPCMGKCLLVPQHFSCVPHETARLHVTEQGLQARLTAFECWLLCHQLRDLVQET